MTSGQETDVLRADNAALRAALEGLAIDGVTAGANPLPGGGMSPPLWHMHCKLCGERWGGQQWKQPRQHPPGKCILAGEAR